MNENRIKDSELARAAARQGFYIHLIVYALVNALLLGINLALTPESRWFVWPLGGWGIGIFFHGLAVFVLGRKPKRT